MRRRTGFPSFEDKGSPGFILLSVLLVSLFMMSAAVGFSWFVRDQLRSLERRRVELESRNIAFMVVQNVVRGLALDTSSYDSKHEKWFGTHLIPLGNRYLLSVTVSPLNDKLPLRFIFLPDGMTVRGEMKEPWELLWEAVGHPKMALSALDFMDSDKIPRVGGFESDFFVNHVPGDPGAFALFSEIPPSAVTGTKDRPGLREYLTLWCGQKVNVNTASAQVLALLDGIDDVVAQEIVERRTETPFTKLSEVAELPAFSGSLGPRLTNSLGTTSDYFLVILQVSALGGEGNNRSYRVVVTKETIQSWEEQ